MCFSKINKIKLFFIVIFFLSNLNCMGSFFNLYIGLNIDELIKVSKPIRKSILGNASNFSNFCIGNQYLSAKKMIPSFAFAYCADKILNKNDYYKENFNKKVKAIMSTFGAFYIVYHSILKFCKYVKSEEELKRIGKKRRLAIESFLAINVLLFNYCMDKILNKNEYYRSNVNKYINGVCTSVGGAITVQMVHAYFKWTFDILKEIA